jgi:hypothetical protein
VQSAAITKNHWYLPGSLEDTHKRWSKRATFDRLDFDFRGMQSQHTVLVPTDRVLPFLQSTCNQLTGSCLEGGMLMRAEVIQYMLDSTSLQPSNLTAT